MGAVWRTFSGIRRRAFQYIMWEPRAVIGSCVADVGGWHMCSGTGQQLATASNGQQRPATASNGQQRPGSVQQPVASARSRRRGGPRDHAPPVPVPPVPVPVLVAASPTAVPREGLYLPTPAGRPRRQFVTALLAHGHGPFAAAFSSHFFFGWRLAESP